MTATIPCQRCRTRYPLTQIFDHRAHYNIAGGVVWACPHCRPVQYYPRRRAARRIKYDPITNCWRAWGGRVNPHDLGAYVSILTAVRRTGIGAQDAVDLTGGGACSA